MIKTFCQRKFGIVFRIGADPDSLKSGSGSSISIVSGSKSLQDVEASEKPSALIREHPALQEMKFINFTNVLRQFFSPGSGSATPVLRKYWIVVFF